MNNFQNRCQALRVVCRRLFQVSGSVGFLTTLQREYTLLSELTVLYYCTAICETCMQEGPQQCTINKSKQTNFLLCQFLIRSFHCFCNVIVKSNQGFLLFHMDAWATVHWFLRAVSLMKNDMGLSSISSKSGPRHLLRVSSPVTFFPSASLKPPSQRFCTKLTKKYLN